MYEEFLITPLTKYIHKMFIHSFNKEWYKTYWCLDLHSTIIKPSYDENDNTVNYYPFAKEVLQLLSNREEILKLFYGHLLMKILYNHILINLKMIILFLIILMKIQIYHQTMVILDHMIRSFISMC